MTGKMFPQYHDLSLFTNNDSLFDHLSCSTVVCLLCVFYLSSGAIAGYFVSYVSGISIDRA
jgi:hypothetical protein